jgi:protein involved in polysaccharide export with SLBB domain
VARRRIGVSGPGARLSDGGLVKISATIGLLLAMVLCAAIAAQVAPAPAALEASLYLIQRGDELSIKIFERPELSDTVTVRPDGRISALLVDDVEAAGLTPEQLDAALTQRYSRFFREPVVSVVVRQAANQRVFVGGEVGQPGVIPITGQLTALAAVYQAGGFRRTARTDSVILLRDNRQPTPMTRKLNLKTANTDAALQLQPHDVIFVPASRIAKVNDFMDQYVRQLVPISLTAGFSYVLGNSVVLTK